MRCARDGKAFSLALTTSQHRHVAAEGRAIGGRAVLRIKDLTGAKSELAELARRSSAAAPRHRYGRRGCSKRCRAPVWARDVAGAADLGQRRLRARRRGARRRRRDGAQSRDPRPAAREGAHARAPPATSYEARLPAIVAGTRRIFEVIDRPRPAAAPASASTPPKPRRCAPSSAAHDRGAPPHARPARDRRRDLHRRPAAHVLQRGLSARCGTSTPAFLDSEPDRFGRARPPARRAQAARGAGLPQLEGRAARGLSRDRGRASTSGTCPTAARCASSPRPIRRAA